MGGFPLFFSFSVAVICYIVAPRCIYLVSGKVTTLTQTLVITLLATLVVVFLTIFLKKRPR